MLSITTKYLTGNAGYMLLRNCRYILTQDKGRRIFENRDVQTEGNTIAKIAKGISAQRGEEIIDCTRKIVMPGLVNTHTHLGMHSLRGKSDDKELFEWLKELEGEERETGAKKVRENTIAGMREAVRFGTTTIYDSYKYPQERAEEFEKGKVRAVVSSTVYDEKTLQHSKAFLNGLNGKIVRGAIAANSVYNCDEKILQQVADYSNEKGILRRIHVGETRKERFEILKKSGKLAIEYLESAGFLGENCLLVHCIWITKGEIAKIAMHKAKVSHNPVSNMKLASGGVMPLPEMHAQKVVVGLGTDSVASNNNLDMFEEMKMCALLHRHHKWDPAILGSQQVLDMATINGAKCLGIEGIGSIEEGKKADIIALNMDENLLPVNDLVSNIVFAAQGLNVNDVVIDGKQALKDREFI